MSAQAEVTRAQEKAENFVDVPQGTAHYFAQASGVVRDSATDSKAAWVVLDENYVSARPRGDVYTFVSRFNLVLGARHNTDRITNGHSFKERFSTTEEIETSATKPEVRDEGNSAALGIGRPTPMCRFNY